MQPRVSILNYLPSPPISHPLFLPLTRCTKHPSRGSAVGKHIWPGGRRPDPHLLEQQGHPRGAQDSDGTLAQGSPGANHTDLGFLACASRDVEVRGSELRLERAVKLGGERGPGSARRLLSGLWNAVPTQTRPPDCPLLSRGWVLLPSTHWPPAGDASRGETSSSRRGQESHGQDQ